MPTYSITAPNGRTYRMSGPEGLEQADLIAHVMEFDPEAGIAPPPPKTGVGAAFSSGLENLVSSTAGGFKGIFGDTQAAAAEALAAEKVQERRYDPQVGLKRVGEAYDKDGIMAAGSEVLQQFPRALAQTAPLMATTIGGAKLGSMAGSVLGPVGSVVGGIGGGLLAGILPYTGSNLARQEETTPGQVDVGKAAGAGAVQAGLETVGPLLLMGGRVAGKIFGADVAQLLSKLGPEAAEKIAARRLSATAARGAAVGGGGEALTEVTQQALERLQAGKPLLNDEALAEYAESAYGGVLVGTPLGSAGHVYDRSGAKQEVADKQQAAAQQAAQRAAEASAAEQQAAAQADAARKADPAYAARVGEEYGAYEAKKKEMRARIAALMAEKTDAGKVAAIELNRELKEFEAASKPLLAEFNATRDARQAAEVQPTGEPAAPEGALFGGYEDAKMQERVNALQAQIAERERDIDVAREQAVAIGRMGDPDAIARARAGLKQRETELNAARGELDKLAPGLRDRQITDAAAADAAAVERMNFDPEEAQRKVAELTAKLEGISDPTELRQSEGWARERKRLQTLLKEHADDTAPGAIESEPVYGEDLFDVDRRVGSEDEQRAQRAQEWDATGETEALYGYAPPEGDPEDQARFTRAVNVMGRRQRRTAMNQAFNTAFAPTTRSAIVDVAAQGQEAAAGQATEGDAIAQRLASMVDDEKFDNAKLLQAHGVNVKAALYAGLKAARAARKPGDSPVHVESFIEAIRKIAAMEQETRGRAHYQPEFYDIAAPLVPGVVQGARRILGMSTAKAGKGTSGRGTALHKATMAREGARLEGVDDPALTAAMEADLEGGATPTKPETGKRHQVTQGVQRPEARTDETGQGFLFEPVSAGPVSSAELEKRQRLLAAAILRPRDGVDLNALRAEAQELADRLVEARRRELRQRIDRLLATPDLSKQARGMLERAAALLGGTTGAGATVKFAADLRAKLLARNETLPKKDRLTPEEIDRQTRSAVPTVSQRVLENITEMVERAERGVGFLPPGAERRAVTAEGTYTPEPRTPEGKQLGAKGLFTPEPRLKGTLRAPAKPAATEREVQGTGTLVGDDGELFPSTPTAKATEGATGEAGAAQRKALVSQAGYLGTAARAAVKEANEAAQKAKADPANEARAYNAKAKAEKARVAVERARAAEEAARPPAQQGREPVKRQRLEMEEVGDAGRDESVQPDMFDDTLYVGRATPANFQRALDTGALPSKGIGKEIKKTIEGLLKTGAMLRQKAAGLRTRIVDAGVAHARLKQVSQVLRSHDPKVIAAATERTRVELMRATNLGLKAAADSAKHAESARETNELVQAATASERPAAEKLQRQHVGRAVRAAQAAVRQEERIEHLRGVLRAFADADAAPALETKARQLVALRTEQSDVAAEIARNDADLKARQGEAQKLQKRVGATTKTPNIERTQPTKLHMQQPAVKAYEPTDAEKARTAANRSGSEYTEITGGEARTVAAKEKVEALQIEGALADAAETVLEVPGVKQADLDEIAARVSKYDTERAFTTRPSVVRNALAAVEAEIEALQRENRGGVLPPNLQPRYRSAILSLPILEQQLKATPGADKRAKLLEQIDRVTSRIREFNAQRTSLANDPRLQALRARQALLEFERDAIDIRREQIRIDETAPATAEVKVAKPRLAAKPATEKGGKGTNMPGVVEPGTVIDADEDALTAMDVTAARRQQKTRFQGKAVPPTPATAAAIAERKADSLAAEDVLRKAREAKEKAGKPRKLTPKQAATVMHVEAAKRAAKKAGIPLAEAAKTDKVLAAALRREADAAAAAKAERNAAARVEWERQEGRRLAALREENAQRAMEAEGGRTVEHLSSTSGASIGTREELFGDHGVGNLDSVLEELETKGSTPLMRELARKLRPLVKNTGLVYTDNPKAAGSFLPGLDRIRLGPKGLTEHTLLHEVTHAATLRTLLAPESELTREQRNARKGLQALLKQLQNDPAFTSDYGAVNLGELASEIMTNQKLRDKIDAKKPGFIRRFLAAAMQMLGMQPARWMNSAKAMAEVEKMFAPSREFTDAELDAAMREKERSAPRIEAYKATLPKELPEARAKQLRGLLKDVMEEPEVSFEHIPMGEFSSMNTAAAPPRGFAGAKAIVKDINAGLAAEMAFVDQRAPILKAMSKASQQAYQQAQYFVRKADARMAQVYAVLQNGPAQLKRDSKGNHIVEAGNGPSAKALFEQIGKLPGKTAEQKFALAQSYMVAQRAANKGWDKLGWETGPAKRAAAERGLAEINADPALKAQLDGIAKTYADYNRGMVQFLADTGAVSKDTAQKLLKDNDYVPFYRVRDGGAAELVMGEGTNINVGDIRRQPHLQQLKGDEGKLMPLNEAVMRNTMLLTDMGLTNLATKNIAYALQGMSPKGTNTIMPGKAPAGADIVKFKQDGDDYWMRIESEGTPFEGIPPEMLVQSLEGSHLVLTGIGKVGAMFGDILRKGVTRSPMYILRQLIRDPMSAAFTAGTSRGPLSAVFKSMREFTAQTRGTSKTAEELLRKGVAQSGIFTGDADDLNAFALQLAKGDQGAITRLVSMADRAAMRADSATRVQVYEDALKATGSEMQAELAAMEMMNFTKRGSHPAVQHAARMIPFMNAQIQGLNVLVKAFRGNMPAEEALQIRQKFRNRALGLAAFSMVYALGMEDDPAYKAATAQERFSNFFVPTPFGTIRVPIPYEVGLLFKVLPEAMARGMSRGLDETDWKALRSTAFNAIPGGGNYGVLPQAVKPMIELAMNSNIYTGRPIESEAQQKIDPAERYNTGTTELAKAIGSAAGVSPLKIEHLVRGYLGGLPLGVASLANEVFADKTMPDRRLSQTPIFGGLIADPLARGAVDRAYAKSNAIEQAGATYDKLLKDGKHAAALKYREDNLNVLMAEPINDNFNRFMAGLRKQRAAVMQSGLPGAELRKQLDHLDAVQNERADLFVKAVKSVVTAH